MRKKQLFRFLGLLLLAALFYGFVYAWKALPIISGYGAKDLCSCTFIGNRSTEDVLKKELGNFPKSMGSFSVNREDSSVTGTVWGLAKRKAVYQKRTGCTLVVQSTEETIRQQKSSIPIPLYSNNPDSLPWPSGNLILPDTLTGIDRTRLKKAVDFAFDEPNHESKRNTRAILVIYNDQLIIERYGEGLKVNQLHTGWSMTKSVINALFGILVRQGKIDLKSGPEFTEWQKDERKNITIDQLLHANSGLKWDEGYSGLSDVTNMLYKQKDMAAYAIKLHLGHKPGTFFTYSSGTSNMLSFYLRKKLGDAAYYQFPYQELFNRIGMHSAMIETDGSGTFVGSSYCFATARDWARFGLLYLHDGIWNGERILPEGWVNYTCTPSNGAALGEYGAQFWLNAGAPGNAARRTYPDVPVDCFYADGYEGQNVWIIPSHKLVVVRLSAQHGNKLDENHFLSELIAALPPVK